MAGNARSGRQSTELTRRVLATYGNRCHLQLPGCEGRATTKDHIVPVAAGGTDHIGNLRPACGPCNSRRADLTLGGIGGVEIVVVVGPPSPEVYDYPRTVAGPRDVIVSYPLLLDAIAGPGTDLQDPDLDRIVRKTVGAASREALRTSTARRIYIVDPVPTIRKLQEYARLRYRIHTIDPGRAVAEHAATIREDRRALREISTWYSRYPDGAASIARSTERREATTTPTSSTDLRPSRSW